MRQRLAVWLNRRRRDSLIGQEIVEPRAAAVTTSLPARADTAHARTGEPVAVLLGHDSDVPVFAFSPDGRLLVTGGPDRTIRLWQLD